MCHQLIVLYKPKPRFTKKCWHCDISGHVRSKCRKFLSSRFHPKRQSHPIYADSSPNSRNSSDFSPTASRGAYRHGYRGSSTDSTASRSLSRDSRRHPRSSSPRSYRKTRSFGGTPVPRWQHETDRRDADDLSDSSRKSTYVISQASLCNASDGDTWIFDSGASHHFCSDRNLLNLMLYLMN